MEYNSFYGGRRGASFVITKSYTSIAEMVSAFSQGGNYKVVDYDNYVIIDTENKNDPDNGKLYRRGYDYNNDMGGAIYEGQIVGPAGLAPHTEMDTINHIEQIAIREGYEYRRGEGEYKPDDNSIVPGKYVESGSGTIKYNDEIKWAYCSVRDIDSKNSTAYIGFTFPYTVIDFSTTLISPYKNGIHIDTTDAVRIDDETHPFYEKWNIKIPNGIKGDDLKNFRVITANNSVQPYEGQADDIANNRQILVYDLYSYANLENGEYLTYYVGDYNKISDITVSSTGSIIIEYTHDDNDTYQLKIPISVTINTGSAEGTGNQKIHITYSDGTSMDIGEPINYIMATALDDRFHLLIYYSDPAKRAEIVLEEKNATYDNKNDWLDLGYLGEGSLLEPLENDIEKLQNEIDLLNSNFGFNITLNSCNMKITDAANGYNQGTIKIGDGSALVQNVSSGKNLFNALAVSGASSNISTTGYSDGEIICAGILNSSSFTIFDGSVSYSANTYTFSIDNVLPYDLKFRFSLGGETVYGKINAGQLSNTFEFTSDVNTLKIYFDSLTSGDFINLHFKLMINTGDTVLDFEQYTAGNIAPSPTSIQPIKTVNGSCNLFVSNRSELELLDSERTSQGVTIKTTSNKITVTETSSTAGGVNIYSTNKALNLANGTHILSISGIDTTKVRFVSLRFQDSSSNKIGEYALRSDGSITVYKNDEAVTYNVYIGLNNETTYDEEIYIQLESGSIATDLVEHKGQTYPLTLPEGVFLGSLETASNYIYGTKDNWKLHQGVQKEILTGSESWNWAATPTQPDDTSLHSLSHTFTGKKVETLVKCSHFDILGTSSNNIKNATAPGMYINPATTQIAFISEYSTSEAFKTWLSNNNIELYYDLETPTDTDITDTTLIEQLNTIADNLQTYKGETIVFTTSDTIKPNIQFQYLIDRFASIEARLDLLELNNSEVSI